MKKLLALGLLVLGMGQVNGRDKKAAKASSPKVTKARMAACVELGEAFGYTAAESKNACKICTKKRKNTKKGKKFSLMECLGKQLDPKGKADK